MIRRFALFAVLIGCLAGCGSTSPGARPRYPTVSVTVGARPTGRPLAPGFLGLSLEYSALPAYAGPAVIQLIRNLAPGQSPVLRIGGNSTDETWWPQPGRRAPRGIKYAVTDSWLAAASALARATQARLILGLNLAGRRPGVAVAETRAFLRGIGGQYIQAFEIGNEPDLYRYFPWPGGPRVLRRPPDYSLSDYIREFSRWRAAIGAQLPVTGPAYATFDWSLARFIDAEPGLKLVTFHHYAFDACLTNRAAAGYPTIPRLLSDYASSGLADQLARSVAVAHAHGVLFRLDELNSASCGGKRGVSDSSASALWMLDALFDLARVGVDGVNVHTFPGAAYAPFGGDGAIHPQYYGMLMFTRAFPPGARLLPVRVSPGGALKAWATVGPDGAIRVVLINKDLHRTFEVHLHGPHMSGALRLQRLRGRASMASPGSITVPAESAVLVAR